SDRQIWKIKAIRKLVETTGTPVVINARTDALRFGEAGEEERFKEAIRRAIAYRDAGADCVYPMGLVDAAPIASFVKALDFPINVMMNKARTPISELQRLG